ncbi:MAG: winged helix-turn-helix domain-containing protein [Actinomycetota bacterium]|nr:winged helix-turn-helix domain-containing protein [Actinomycetota bacterium]
MTEHLDEARKAIEDRLALLRDEIKRLETAAAALGGGNGRRGPGRPRGSTTRRSTSARPRRRGRPRGSGTRALQAEKLVRENPGISIADLAKRMNIKPNYLYRVMPQLQKDGKVRKQGSGWHAG